MPVKWRWRFPGVVKILPPIDPSYGQVFKRCCAVRAPRHTDFPGLTGPWMVLKELVSRSFTFDNDLALQQLDKRKMQLPPI